MSLIFVGISIKKNKLLKNIKRDLVNKPRTGFTLRIEKTTFGTSTNLKLQVANPRGYLIKYNYLYLAVIEFQLIYITTIKK